MAGTPQTHYARHGDLHIAYQTIGHGPLDIVVAPGFISHLDLNWTMPAYVDFVRDLARFGRVILFDKRGTGLSDVSFDAADFEARMQDIEVVMDAAGATDAVVFGMSEGGPLASLFAATHPNRVRQLVLYGTFPAGSVIDDATMEAFAHAVDHWGSGETAGIFLKGSDGPVVRRFTGLFERAAASPGIARALLRSIRACDVSSVLPQLHVPTLVINRLGDPFAVPAWSDAIAAAVPDGVHVEVDGSDHMPWMGDRGPIVDAIGEFVTGAPVESPSSKTLATVLFTDIVDSTQELARRGDRAWAELMQRHSDICRQSFAAAGAWAVKSTGDGFMACFDTPDRGVRCAQELHQRVEDIGLRLRAGLNAGELERVDVDDVAGLTVNTAARIAGTAQTGQTHASRALADLLIGSRHLVTNLGFHELKGIPGAVELVSINDVPAEIDLRDPEKVLSAFDDITLRLAKHAPGFIRRVASFSGA